MAQLLCVVYICVVVCAKVEPWSAIDRRPTDRFAHSFRDHVVKTRDPLVVEVWGKSPDDPYASSGGCGIL
jgi:hypothetical protein